MVKKSAPLRAMIAFFVLFLSLAPRGGFSETTRLGGKGNDYAYSACLLSNGNRLLLGETFSESNAGKAGDDIGIKQGSFASAWAVCLDENDEVVWQYRYAGKAEANTRFLGGVEQDDRYILYATQGQSGDDAIVVLDSSGAEKRIVPMRDNVDVYGVCPSPKGLVIAGLTWDDAVFRPFCALADASGEIVWSYAGEPLSRIEGRCPYAQMTCNDDHILLYETRLSNSFSEETEVYLSKIDFSGNRIARIQLDAPPIQYISKMIAHGDDVLFIGSNYDMEQDLHSGAIVKLGEKTEISWEWSASYPDSNLVIQDLLILEDQYFVCGLRYDYRDSVFTQIRTGLFPFDGSALALQPLAEYGSLSNPKALLISQNEVMIFGNMLIRTTQQTPQEEMDVFISRMQI